MVKVIDNTGARMAECIKVLRKQPKSAANVGDKVVVVIQEARPVSTGSNSNNNTSNNTNKVKRGDICRAVIVRTRSPIRREDGTVVRFDDNACVLINDKDEPIGSRVSSAVAKELRKKKFNKIVSLAPVVI